MGATQVYMKFTREKHPTDSRMRKKRTKIYKARDIEKSIDRDPFKE
jgi:hypothetical protein